MKRNLLLLWITGLLEIPVLYTQTPSYHHYTASDGLASSIVYEMAQDREGFIWFATANGISRFDGSHFKTFRTQDGLNSNSNTSIAEGSNGEMYIGNYEKGINVRRHGQFGSLCTEIGGKRFPISFLIVVLGRNGEKKIYAYRSWGSIAVINEKPFTVPAGQIISLYPKYLNKLVLLQNGKLIGATTDGLYLFESDTLTKIMIKGLPDQAFYCCAPCDEGFLTGTRGMIYRISNARITGTYRIALADENDVSVILEDRQGNIWFSIMNRGFYCIPGGSGEIIDMGIKLGLQHSNVNNYLEDAEGNIWISTYGKGVFCLNNMYLKTLDETDGLSNNCVYSLLGDKQGNLLAGTFNGLNILKNGVFERVRSDSNKTLTEYIHSIKRYQDEFYICGGFRRGSAQSIKQNGFTMHMLDHLSFCRTHNGWYLFGTAFNNLLTRRGLNGKDSHSRSFHVFGDSVHVNRINEIFEDSEYHIWIGTSLGLCRVADPGDTTDKGEWKKSFFPSDLVLNSRINSICEARDKTIWIAGEKGVSCIRFENDSITTFTHMDGYDLSSSTSLAIDNKERIWIGNMKGLYLIDGNEVRFLNKTSGLPSDEVYSLYFHPGLNMLYVGTNNGISMLDIGLFDSYHPSAPRVKITGIKAGDSVFTDFSNPVFTPNPRDVNIDFTALHFSSPGSVRYRYKLNEEWVTTNHDFLNLLSPRHGEFQLQIMAKAHNTGWGEPCMLTFRVQPKFTETGWFYLLIVFVALTGTILIGRWRLKMNNRKIRKELETAERINQLKHQALSAMMNPHFISNSLNSVQYLVNCGRYEEANDYITMIARLMRKNLDTAGSGFILLSEELYRLQLYLDLEKLRFQGSFSYEIIAGHNVDTNAIMIPNMIIQPFVENSLWHGIIDSGNQGKLTVSFSFEEVTINSSSCQALIIKVVDNGIGIQAARKNKKGDHISRGISIIEERLRLLSMKMQLPSPVSFEDLTHLGADSHGTEVIISLPPSLYKLSVPESCAPVSPAG